MGYCCWFSIHFYRIKLKGGRYDMRIDSPIISAGIKLTNLLILNLYWVIGCLPVITIGTSTIAAFSVTLKMTEDREGASMTVQFWKAYVKKQNTHTYTHTHTHTHTQELSENRDASVSIV